MHINLNQLRCFYLAAKHQSISKAAEELFVTPPAITMQIKKLEEWLGIRLLVRHGNTLKLAKNVESIFKQAEVIFSEVERFELQIDKLVKNSSKEILIGSHPIPAKYIMPQLMHRIQQLDRQFDVKVVLDTVPNAIEKLRTHELHFALTGSPDDLPKLKKIPLFEEELVLICKKGSKHVSRETISISDIGQIPLLLPENNTSVFDIINDYLVSGGIEPCIAMENINADIIKNFLRQDMGAAFLLKFTVQDKLESGEFQQINIAEGYPVVQFSLSFLDEKRPSAEVGSLVSHLKKIRLNRSDLIV